MTLTVGSLFSGIGGLDLGLERAGMNVIWQSEIDPYASRVLAKHWPEVPNYGDIKLIDWSRVERPSVICGGYPCQPFSTAGNRKGEEDPRHLWPWVRQAISELRPDYAILENVRGHLSLGGTTVIADLAAIGYDAEWRIISAASVGANHRRDRIIIVAYPNNPRSRASEHGTHRNGTAESLGWRFLAQRGTSGRGTSVADADGGHAPDGRQCEALPGKGGSWGNDRSGSGSNSGQVSLGSPGEDPGEMADTDGGRRQQRQPETEPLPRTGSGGERVTMADSSSGNGGKSEPHRLPTVYGQASELREQGRLYGSFGNWWKTEPDVGRVAHGIPARVDRLRGLGNAVVPQVAEVIGRLVIAHHEATQ